MEMLCPAPEVAAGRKGSRVAKVNRAGTGLMWRLSGGTLGGALAGQRWCVENFCGLVPWAGASSAPPTPFLKQNLELDLPPVGCKGPGSCALQPS